MVNLWNFLFCFQVVLAACCLSVSMVTYSSFQNFTTYSALHVHTWMSSVYGMDSGIGIISEFILWFLQNKVRCSDMWHETSFRKYSCFASMTRSKCMSPGHCSSDQDTAASSCSRWRQIQRPTAGQGAESERPWNTPSLTGYLYQISPLRVQRTLRNETQKECKNQREGKSPRKEGLLDTAGLMHMWTHRDCSSMHRTWISVTVLIEIST